MVDKSQWPIVDPEFVMVPPKLERSAGRPRVKRIKSKGEPEKGVLTNAKDASSLGILRRVVVSRLLNSLLNCHRQLLLIQGKLTPYTFAVT
jgi:hypothetical protein